MEREVWRWIAPALRRLPRWWPRGAVYDNRSILAVLLWAALHDRAILWACQRANWPVQAWRRCLPDQSTMSRRLRDPRVLEDLSQLLHILQRDLPPATRLLIVDGKPLSVSWFSGDPDATGGWGAGHHQRGYKLHVLIDNLQRLLAWEVHPMNRAESVVARDLLTQAARRGVLPGGSVLLGDASYDSNPLHEHAEQLRVQLLAPRRKAHRTISSSYRQHPNRLTSIALTEREPVIHRRMQLIRATVERYLGGLATVGGGLISLPAWARRLSRVRLWTASKLILHAARLSLRRCLVA